MKIENIPAMETSFDLLVPLFLSAVGVLDGEETAV